MAWNDDLCSRSTIKGRNKLFNPTVYVGCNYLWTFPPPVDALLGLCAGNSPVTGENPTQRPVTRSFDFFLWIYGWVNYRKAGYLTRHRAHYDVIVMHKFVGYRGAEYATITLTSSIDHKKGQSFHRVPVRYQTLMVSSILNAVTRMQ